MLSGGLDQIDATLRNALELGLRAPSAHNTQPWLLQISETAIDIYRDSEHTLASGDPTLRQTFISLGCLSESLMLALQAYGIETQSETYAFMPRRLEKIATLTICSRRHAIDDDLIAALSFRRTNRGAYDPTPMPDSAQKDLLAVRHAGVVGVHTVEETAKRSVLSELLREAIVVGLSLPPLKRELASLVSYADQARMTGLVYENMTADPRPRGSAATWVQDGLDPATEGARLAACFQDAPLILLLTVEQESADAWIEVGRTLFRVLIAAARHGLSHCIAAAPIEVPTIAPRLRRDLNLNGRPEVLLRLGYPMDSVASIQSRRRPLVEIVKG